MKKNENSPFVQRRRLKTQLWYTCVLTQGFNPGKKSLYGRPYEEGIITYRFVQKSIPNSKIYYWDQN